MSDSISGRKKDHVRISLTKPVRFEEKTNGFEIYEFDHYALPEINLADIDTSFNFLDYKLSQPLIISGMTGGYKQGEEINQRLVQIAEQNQIGFGIGSMRPILSRPSLLDDYAALRSSAKSIPFIGNLGAVNLFREIDRSIIDKIFDKIQPDAIAVHLNPLQEAIQPEGDTNFRGVLKNIKKLVKISPVPVIVKETGAGINGKIAAQLVDAGVSIIDVSGAGGTSWSAVEAYRTELPTEGLLFKEWGVPTAVCIEECRNLDGVTLIASGGISNGLIMAKAIALGAQLCAAAYPVLKCLMDDGEEAVNALLKRWRKQLSIAMFLTKSESLNELSYKKLRRTASKNLSL